MSTPQTQVFASTTQTNVVTVATPGPQGPTGPLGNPGPTGPASGPTGPTGPAIPPSAPVFSTQVIATVPSGITDSFSPFGYIPGVTNALILTPTDVTSTLAGLASGGVQNGFSIFVWNSSATVDIQLLSSGSGTSANQFLCPQNSNATLEAYAGVIMVYLTGFGWTTFSWGL